ncbi:restriction endonuclease subunit S [Clostridium sporogenes]|uniref:restriction endonuclease subunit S n=1 Tax=Clostridium sporogenes TaxID=1509 RepID=UPI000E179A4D|nr:restriction endonuclease subunit S [Clostridium sporogenes]EJE7233974.1 restriction endonuclease subunit S [Clostridium botulinum]NFE79094.1 restriction endonuclease subunit S [Clostridium sporogenes]NFG67180.1 restriction endonuclease subunit S [Clostridium sporogenes]NFT01874.1 restriction endonuclease subunit S [Clostridium sporogenes]NFT30996.1 restriction endonuclease subunit S [Clostridium sporogenes]
MKKYRIDEITINLDNMRKPLNNVERNKISKRKLYPYYGANNLMDYVDEYIFDEEILCVAEDGGSWGYKEKCSYIVNRKCWVNNHAHVLKAKENLNLKFLNYYLNFNDLSSSITGTTRGKLTKSALNNIEVLLPQLEVQNKIVNILDKAQSLIKKRKTQIEALDELVKSRFIEMFGDPVKNPMKLPKTTLSNIGQWKTGGTPSRSNNEYYNGNIPWLSSGELNNIYCFNSDEMITELAIKESSAKIIEKGSLLLGMYDTAALKSTINMIECSCNQAIAYAKLDENLVNTIYVYYCIQIGKDFYKSKQRGVRQKNLNLSMVKELEILMPELKLQNQFADFVNQGNTLKFEMKKSLKELEDNFNSLMQRAFKGELFN